MTLSWPCTTEPSIVPNKGSSMTTWSASLVVAGYLAYGLVVLAISAFVLVVRDRIRFWKG
jgi:hypothetical protein